MKIIKYQINHKQKVIHETLRGEITSEEFLTHQKEIIEDPQHDWSYSILSDIRDSAYNYPDDVANDVFKVMQDINKNYQSGCKCAFVTHKPMEVARTYLYKKGMANHSQVQFKIFSSLKGAQLWLNISED